MSQNKTIDTLVDDVYALLDGGDLVSSIGRFQDDIGKMMLKRFSAHTERPATLRMSNIGRPLRQLWYEINGPKPEALTGKTRFKFLYGDIIETLFLFLAEASGHKVERLQEEVVVDGIVGHIDAVIDGVLVDVKSCSSYSYQKFRDGSLLEVGNDPFGYISQLSGYRRATGLRALFIAVDKTVGSICLLELPENDYDIHARISQVRQAVSALSEPERCYDPVPVSKSDKTGNLVLDVPCAYCGWKEHCWRDSNEGQGLKTLVYSTGPKFFVKIVKEPRLSSQKLDVIQFPTKDQVSNG